jgi:hypothetical protein
MFNINLFRWEKALSNAEKYNVPVNTVLAYRKKYL